MVSLNSFAMYLIGIFIPIYLLKLGYSFQIVILYLMIHHSMILVSAFGSVYVANKIGLVGSLKLRFVFLFVYLFFLYSLADQPWLLFIIPIISGMEAAFYWEPLNILFVRHTKKEKMGTAISKFYALPRAFTLLSPIVGAFIATYFGFPVLFIVAIFIFIIAIMPILSLRSEKTNFVFTWNRFREIYKNNKHYFIPEIIENLTEDAVVIWSIFIYLELLSVVKVGIIGTLTELATIFFTLTLGKLTDNWNRRKLMRVGALLVTLIWVFNFFIGQFTSNEILFYIATILLALVMKVFLVPYGSYLYNQARKDDAQFLVLP